jgi:hypothetical protein
MKTITLTPKDFVLFQTLANRMELIFTYYVSGGNVHVEADITSLEGLGY